MDSQDKRLVTILLTTAFFMLIAGCLFVPFVVNIWVYIANLAGEKDMFLASTLTVYFVMWALVGISVGILLNHYFCPMLERIRNRNRN